MCFVADNQVLPTMEFRFNLNNYIKQELTKIQSSLIPEGFTSQDRNEYGKCVEAVTEILHDMGIASQKAQGLNAPITSAEKLKNSDQILYLFSDLQANNGRGLVVGLLKIGEKNLFLVDRTGKLHEKKAMCILDFYVHESKQRMGCGKYMFDRMLKDMKVLPESLAIDKPSNLFLKFLEKHYGLHKVVPQNNNFVVFEEFFQYTDLASTNRRRDMKNGHHDKVQSVQVGTQQNGMTNYGRHAALKPVSTMGDILQPNHQHSNNNNNINEKCSKTIIHEVNVSPIDTEPASSERSLSPVSCASSQGPNSGRVSPAFSCRSDDPERLDLKFHHTHLW